MTIPFDRDFDAPYGVSLDVGRGIRRLLAPNPGPFTFKGTGVYIIGDRDVAVIDPGPDIAVHVEALKRALEGKQLRHILITHTHSDHSPAAAPLKAWSGAKTYAFAPHGSAKAEDAIRVEEGGDMRFVPDVVVCDGDMIAGDGYNFECVYTPGHTSNHMSYALREEKALFTGDHVMGWSTTVVAPPDGNMADYMTSLRKLALRDDEVLWPTHGGPIRAPKPFIEAYIAHRLERERQITDCIAAGIDTIPEMVAHIYAGVDKALHPAAARSVLAHLIKLEQEGRIRADATAGTPRYDLIR